MNKKIIFSLRNDLTRRKMEHFIGFLIHLPYEWSSLRKFKKEELHGSHN